MALRQWKSNYPGYPRIVLFVTTGNHFGMTPALTFLLIAEVPVQQAFEGPVEKRGKLGVGFNIRNSLGAIQEHISLGCELYLVWREVVPQAGFEPATRCSEVI